MLHQAGSKSSHNYSMVCVKDHNCRLMLLDRVVNVERYVHDPTEYNYGILHNIIGPNIL